MSEDENDPIGGLKPFIEAAVAVGSASAGFAVGGFAGTALGAGSAPLVMAGIQHALEVVRHRRASNAVKVVDEAATAAKLDPNELLGRLAQSPVGQELLVRALEAGARSTLDEKIRALGRSLAAGALGAGGHVVDNEMLFVLAMADFERPHISVLEYLAADSGRPGQPRSAHISELARLVGEVGVNPIVGLFNDTEPWSSSH